MFYYLHDMLFVFNCPPLRQAFAVRRRPQPKLYTFPMSACLVVDQRQSVVVGLALTFLFSPLPLNSKDSGLNESRKSMWISCYFLSDFDSLSPTTTVHNVSAAGLVLDCLLRSFVSLLLNR